MAPLMLAAVGHGSTALWYLTRATGLVSLILLSATVVLGIVSSVGWATERWPRFLSQAVHRNLSLLCLAVIIIHVVTTVGDGYVPIGLADAIIPFLTPYRPLWVGLGALAFDLLLAVAITSALRHRIGARAWRGVHWLAYLCWPIALLHGFGAGSDSRLPVVLFINVACVVAVVAAVGWRLAVGPDVSPRWRFGAVVAGALFLAGTILFVALGPLRPGWSHRAGTSAAVLEELSAAQQPVAATGQSATRQTVPSTTSTAPSTAAPVDSTQKDPAVPFSRAATGTYRTSGPDGAGNVVVHFHMALQGSAVPLEVTLTGAPVNGSVAMSASQVSYGGRQGVVTSLVGSTIAATVGGPGGSIGLTMQLTLDRATGTITGTVSGASPR